MHVNDWPPPQGGPQWHPDDHQRRSPSIIDVFDNGPVVKPKGKKDKKSDEKKFDDKKSSGPVDIQFEGYMLERAEPLFGQKASWARIGKRALPFDDAKLVALVKAHRQRTRTGPATDFALLTSNQQGIIDRLIQERKLDEKNSNADWILSDVQRYGKWNWRSLDVRKIQVILKRQEKNATARPGERTTSSATSSYQFGEIIDLAEPLVSKTAVKGGAGGKKGGNKGGNKQQDDEILDILDDTIGLGMTGANNRGPAHGQGHHNNHHGQGHENNHQQQAPHVVNHFHQPAPVVEQVRYAPPPPPPPPGPIPMDQFQPHHGPMEGGNPFMPNPNVMPPTQFDPPFYAANDERGGNSGARPSARVRTRSPSRPRRRSNSARRIKQLEGDIDNLREEVLNKIEDWHVSDESSFGGDSVFSPAQSGGSFSPPSTPDLEGPPRGSLHRRKSSDRRPAYREQPREARRYQNERVEVRPAYAPRPARGRFSPERPRYTTDRRGYSSERQQYSPERPRYVREPPRLERAITYDDYPVGRVAEPRYVAPRIQRRLTNYEEGYEPASFGEQFGRRQGEARRRQSDADEAYEAGRREALRREELQYERRRDSGVGRGPRQYYA